MRAKDPELGGPSVSHVCNIRRESFILSFEDLRFFHYPPSRRYPRMAFSSCVLMKNILFQRNLRSGSPGLEELIVMVNVEKKKSKIW